MNFLIISHTPHYRAGNQLVGWGPTVREIDQLSTLFDSVCHLAPVHDEAAPASSLPYEAANVRIREVKAAGGPRLSQKLQILTRVPEYFLAMRDEIRQADVVHVRCPASISFLALIVLKFLRWRGPLWIKYAGAWAGWGMGNEAWSYRAQRKWLIQGWKHALVTVNGSWPGQPPHIHSFYNPSIDAEEMGAARKAAAGKRLKTPVRLLFVGRLDVEKGFPVFLETVHELHRRGIPVEADLAGDGPLKAQFESQVKAEGLSEQVRFLGWQPRSSLNQLYSAAHFILLPSKASEGWPKVLSEAMAHGAIPLAGNVGSVAQFLADFGCGRSIPADDWKSYANAIESYLGAPALWDAESEKAVAAAERFTFDWHLDAVSRHLSIPRHKLVTEHV